MFIFIIVVCVILYLVYKIVSVSDSEQTTKLLEKMERTEDQKKVIRYFCNEPGCLYDHRMKDEEFDNMLAQRCGVDFKKMALEKIGLDEDELKEIEPICFENYSYTNVLGRRGKDGQYRTSGYQVTWLFFSETQVFIYTNIFNLDSDEKKISTEEYFYKDITNFSTVSETEEVTEEGVAKNKDVNKFAITVPGDKFKCVMRQNEVTERAIQGMKAKLREKKNA